MPYNMSLMLTRNLLFNFFNDPTKLKMVKQNPTKLKNFGLFGCLLNHALIFVNVSGNVSKSIYVI